MTLLQAFVCAVALVISFLIALALLSATSL